MVHRITYRGIAVCGGKIASRDIALKFDASRAISVHVKLGNRSIGMYSIIIRGRTLMGCRCIIDSLASTARCIICMHAMYSISRMNR